MTLNSNVQVLENCLCHLSELAEIHVAGLGHAKHIERDMQRVERLLARLAPQRHALKPARSAAIPERWVEDIVAAYRSLGGNASHGRLYAEVRRIRLAAGRSLPEHFESLVRQTLQSHCSSASQYKGGPDLFIWIRSGHWGLRQADI
jgi:hypothetical protein